MGQTLCCPQCRATEVQRLDATSRDSDMDYFRCQACTAVWVVTKGVQPRRSWIVAQGRERQSE
jgi:hypothetical protein